MTEIIAYITLGLTTGIISGIVGIGGGIIIIPALVFLFGFTQHQAQGTTLAILVPPIGLMAAYTYYQSGYVNLNVALFICIGFFIGGFAGSKIAVSLSNQVLEKIFGSILVIVGLYMWIKK